jgi:hypothetical protein
MKQYARLAVVVLGSIGILSLIIEDAFFTYPDTPLMSLQLFKYFTVQSNLFAVIYFWLLYSLKIDEKSEKAKNLLGGVMIYTTITFLIFAIVLERLYTEQGFTLVGSILLHYINPILIIGYTVYYKKEYSYQLKDTITWIIYPLLYLVFMIIWGSITGDYLYPFFQVAEVGISGLILSILGLLVLFLLMSFSVVKILSKK